MSYASSLNLPHKINCAEKYMALMFDKNIFLFNQGDIFSFESFIDVRSEETGNNKIGTINVSGYDVPVYCLDDDLSIMKEVPASRSVCVILKSLNYALLCKDIRVLEYDEMDEAELPECMLRQHMPISRICIYKTSRNVNEKYAMLVSANALEEYIVTRIRH